MESMETNSKKPRVLILETSGRAGQAALGQGETILQIRRFDETRRHARDLAPAVGELLTGQGWRPRDVQVVIVSLGPGSYTGLRVGIMSAKAFAFATGCALIGVETFSAIAGQAPEEVLHLAVLADAQQDKVYEQRFGRASPQGMLLPEHQLTIRSFPDWLASLEGSEWASGPGLRQFGQRLPAHLRVVPADAWDPRPESLLEIGLPRFVNGQRDDLWTLEPLYLRPSAAEEKWFRSSTGGVRGGQSVQPEGRD